MWRLGATSRNGRRRRRRRAQFPGLVCATAAACQREVNISVRCVFLAAVVVPLASSSDMGRHTQKRRPWGGIIYARATITSGGE